MLFFHINGLTNEYDGDAVFLRSGRPTSVPAMTELEEVSFDEFGTLEAFVTSGGTSTVPYSLEGQLDAYENKTLRFPGHFAQFKAFKDLGLFREETVSVGNLEINPREFYHHLLAPQLDVGPSEDVCVMRVVGTGIKDGRSITVTVDLIDRFDRTTGFAAMERLTGWHAAIVADFIARGSVRPGVVKLEEAIPAVQFMDAVRRRGFHVSEERWA